MNEELGTCEQCQIEKATHLMWPTTTDRDQPSRPVPMCEDCATAAFEAGTHESDEN